MTSRFKIVLESEGSDAISVSPSEVSDSQGELSTAVKDTEQLSSAIVSTNGDVATLAIVEKSLAKVEDSEQDIAPVVELAQVAVEAVCARLGIRAEEGALLPSLESFNEPGGQDRKERLSVAKEAVGGFMNRALKAIADALRLLWEKIMGLFGFSKNASEKASKKNESLREDLKQAEASGSSSSTSEEASGHQAPFYNTSIGMMLKEDDKVNLQGAVRILTNIRQLADNFSHVFMAEAETLLKKMVDAHAKGESGEFDHQAVVAFGKKMIPYPAAFPHQKPTVEVGGDGFFSNSKHIGMGVVLEIAVPNDASEGFYLGQRQIDGWDRQSKVTPALLDYSEIEVLLNTSQEVIDSISKLDNDERRLSSFKSEIEKAVGRVEVGGETKLTENDHAFLRGVKALSRCMVSVYGNFGDQTVRICNAANGYAEYCLKIHKHNNGN